MNVLNLKWKYHEHKQLIRYGIRHNILRDLISKNYRRLSFELWDEFPRNFAKTMGCEFTNDTPSRALQEIFVDKIYDINGFVPKVGDVVIDVGASYGDSAIWWSKVKGASVFAFEPLKDVFRILEANVALNKADVKTFNIAIGNGEPVNSNRVGSMLIRSNCANGNILETAKLDDLGIQKMEILKIDVEGFELDVLKGAKNCIERFRPRIIIETHSTELRNNCDQFLKNMGYTLRVEGRKVKPKNSWMDSIQNLFYSSFKTK
ncbi:MAG TPA: FkbM family methyltransferase [Thermoplasmataceae archaeon]|nr:FkbM family methyltransferase [Thermoplasmataceae archaeon]